MQSVKIKTEPRIGKAVSRVSPRFFSVCGKSSCAADPFLLPGCVSACVGVRAAQLQDNFTVLISARTEYFIAKRFGQEPGSIRVQ